MGDNMVAVIPAFAQHLNKAAANNLLPDSPSTSDSVYFDLCGLWLISYRASTAQWLHSSVFSLILLVPPHGVQRGPMAKMAGICVLSMLSCLAMPAAIGGLRAFLSGIAANAGISVASLLRFDLCLQQWHSSLADSTCGVKSPSSLAELLRWHLCSFGCCSSCCHANV